MGNLKLIRMNTKLFAECIKRNMGKQGGNLEDLSAKSDIPVPRLEELISGDIKPKAKEIFAIGGALKVPPLILKRGGGVTHAIVLNEDGKRVCVWNEY